MSNTRWMLSLAVAGALVAYGCGQREEMETEEPMSEPAAEQPAAQPAASMTATATFQAAEGMALDGAIEFTQDAGGVRVTAKLNGVQRAGLHGLHLHETGDCTAHDFTSAGGHFNPTGAPHGCPGDDVRHAGDFGNIEIAADGSGNLDLTTDMVTVAEGPTSVVGKAVILHEGEDDCVTQPTGNAGGRLACAVVEMSGMAGTHEGMEAAGTDDSGEGGGGQL
jgi:Cu-Zn family superoxide dismutase